MNALSAPGFPEPQVRERARLGVAAAFPDPSTYGHLLHGSALAQRCDGGHGDPLDAFRWVPPAFMPQRLAKLIELGREPVYGDVRLDSVVGGFRSPFPFYVSALGSTRAANSEHLAAVSRQAGRLGIPLVIGENVMPVLGYERTGPALQQSLLERIDAYTEVLKEGHGGLVVQQSTEDADAEVWNLVYSHPDAHRLLEQGRLAFELKTGQGAKPGLGGLTLVDRDSAGRLEGQYGLDPVYGTESERLLRHASPGTFTEEILRQQIRLMRNNYPRVKVWVKLPPGRDVAAAARVAWEAGADAVTIDGAEGGTGWAPRSFLSRVGLPLGECLARIGPPSGTLLASGRIWEGVRTAVCLALGATGVGLGRAALISVSEDRDNGLVNLVECLALELRMLISAVGKYDVRALGREDLWAPTTVPYDHGPGIPG
ncbi:glutamate synthase-related protein [Streptomyces koyangensis]|uniref:Glutamate synthase n=1 Tax=Streptomyces koyangensis TaxID=188770 RepID=A0A385D6D8_9ACTN|nr:glutamate synthase-related protein [Streptomyces koyangensis]AXQ53530.1 glutamate synthase [Streptomyces koyangensis]